MSSNVVKCPNCNVVINEVLAFICNKVDVMDEESISRICISAFSGNDILSAKNLLFDSLPTTRRKKIRKRLGKSLRDIDDIITVIKESDPEDFPIFVARDLQKLPPVLFDHVDVTRILKDLVRMQNEILTIKEQYATAGELNDIKLDLESLKNASIVNTFKGNVNMKRGACLINSFEYNSGPMGLPPLHNEVSTPSPLHNEVSTPKNIKQLSPQAPRNYRSIPKINLSLEGSVAQQTQSATGQRANELAVSKQTQAGRAAESKRATAAAVESRTIAPERPERPERASTSSVEAMTHAQRIDSPVVIHTAPSVECTGAITAQDTIADIVRGGVWKPETPDENWNTVQRRRLRNRFVGSRGKAITISDEKFKAADVKTPIYIYNVAKEVSVCDIQKYVQAKANIDVTLFKMNMKKSKDYDAYKIFVPKIKEELFLSDDFWPVGIAFRRFLNLGYRNYDRVNSVNQLKS
ncbi:Mutant cadherin [Operophtera brumata]|uniref:Mutant cadherin n=1 Tax=Operophtera brumata TaxID=104452 RepID=A0A0L7L6C1_OPEBR|nr:Mutant cadherin [Operophtera brumata]